MYTLEDKMQGKKKQKTNSTCIPYKNMWPTMCMILIGLQEVTLACIAWFLTTGGLDGYIGKMSST